MMGDIGITVRLVPKELWHKQAGEWLVRGEVFTPNPDILFLILKMVRVFIYKGRMG